MAQETNVVKSHETIWVKSITRDGKRVTLECDITDIGKIVGALEKAYPNMGPFEGYWLREHWKLYTDLKAVWDSYCKAKELED